MICRSMLAALTVAVGLSGCFRLVVRDVVIRVPQMTSPECASVIQDALRGLDGVLTATPDFASRTCTVRYDSERLAIRNIQYVIAGKGFDADDLPASPEARAKLPPGCQ